MSFSLIRPLPGSVRLVAFLIAGAAAGFAQANSSGLRTSLLFSDASETVEAMAVDRDGGIWVTGQSTSTFDAPGPNWPFQSSPRGMKDVFVAKYKFAADGSLTREYWFWIGGQDNDEARAIAVDAKGRVYVTGTTSSTDFPVSANAAQSAHGGGIDTFIVIIDPSQQGDDSLVYSSYHGALGTDQVTAIAVGEDGSAVIVGWTNSENLPHSSAGAQSNGRGGMDAFVLRLDPNGSPTYGSYLGGTLTDIPTGVVLDRNGLIWFSGYTASDDFPVTDDGVRTVLYGVYDTFLVAIDPRISGLEGFRYGTYLGGSASDVGRALQIDSAGRFWIAGYTNSPDLPVSFDGAQRAFGGNWDGFVMRVDVSRPPDQAVTYATYLGGPGADILYAFTLLEGGRFAAGGYTMLGGFPTAGPGALAASATAWAEGFFSVVRIDPGASPALEFSTHLGGTYDDVVLAVGAGPDAVYAAGFTNSNNFRTTDGSAREAGANISRGFVARLNRE